MYIYGILLAGEFTEMNYTEPWRTADLSDSESSLFSGVVPVPELT